MIEGAGRRRRAEQANLKDLWAWAHGGDEIVGVDEQLRQIRRELRVQSAMLGLAIVAANPVTAHFLSPLLKGLGGIP